MLNLNKNINIIGILNLYKNKILIALLIILLIIAVYNTFIKSFDFQRFGDRLSESPFNIFDHKFYTNFGLKKNDNLDFIINIRNSDASDDCNIKGRFKEGGIEKISIIGDGPKCSRLKSNNL